MFFGEKFISIAAIAKYREAPARSQIIAKMFFWREVHSDCSDSEISGSPSQITNNS
jgi:hypothetical protein